jgi:hypothetical protein
MRIGVGAKGPQRVGGGRISAGGRLIGSGSAPIVGAPEPGVGDTILIAEDHFDGADITTQLTGYATRGSISRQAPGRGGSGACLRFNYLTSSVDNLIEKGFTNSHEVYTRYWFRVSPGWVPYSELSGSGMKWFMLWRPEPNVVRYTFGVGKLVTPNYQFTSHDNSSSGMPVLGWPQNVSLVPRFATTNDGNWHKYTIRVNGTSGAGGGEQIWIDDVLVLDDFSQNFDHNDTGLELIQLPGVVVDGIPDASWEGWIDIDDFVAWHK